MQKPIAAQALRLKGVVDPGATRLVLPAFVAKQLGLPAGNRIRVQYADRRTRSRDMVTGVWLELQGRTGVFDAIVEPKRSTALIGAFVLEILDFLVDSAMEKLVPRDPNQLTSEIEDIGGPRSRLACRIPATGTLSRCPPFPGWKIGTAGAR